MKSVDTILATVGKRLDSTWYKTLAGDSAHWPHPFPLAAPSPTQARTDFPAAQEWSLNWQSWARRRGLELRFVNRSVSGTTQSLPSHLLIGDIDTAARVAGDGHPARLRRARDRAAAMEATFPGHPDLWQVVRTADSYTDVDFDLLLRAAQWFRAHPTSGLSPRQVPVEGMHSKWLHKRLNLVRTVAQLPDLGLTDTRPVGVHLTYLDPVHLEPGTGRVHDCVYPGFDTEPAYRPRVVMISENKDTAVLFPRVQGGIAMQGHGNAGPALISRLDWVRAADRVIYWGDLDAKGLQIVNDYRALGVDIETILMDAATLTRFARYQSLTDDKGVTLTRSPRKPLPHLTGPERDAYHALTAADDDAPIRVEQERIPLNEAVTALSSAGIQTGPLPRPE